MDFTDRSGYPVISNFCGRPSSNFKRFVRSEVFVFRNNPIAWVGGICAYRLGELSKSSFVASQSPFFEIVISLMEKTKLKPFALGHCIDFCAWHIIPMRRLLAAFRVGQ